MIDNPWYTANTADYERRRVLDEFRQIRLQQKATEAASRERASARSHPTMLRTFRHAALLVAKAALTILLG